MLSSPEPSRLILSAALLFVLVATPVGTAAQGQNGVVRVYETRFLGAETALRLAYLVCGQVEDGCNVQDLGRQTISVRALPGIHEQLAALLAERDVPPATQEFRVILVRASRSGDDAELPSDAAAALEDLRAVTSFTGFEVIDTALVRTAGRANTQLGPLGSFGVGLEFEGDPRRDEELLVHLSLDYTPAGSVVDAPEEAELAIPLVSFGDTRSLLRSQFGIRPGETVVVGTSRLNGGDEALVALLTAIER